MDDCEPEQAFYKRLFDNLCSARKDGVDSRPMLRAAVEEAEGLIDKVNALSLLSVECEHRRDLEGAEAALLRAADLAEDSPSSWAALGRFYAGTMRDAKAARGCIERMMSCPVSEGAMAVYARCELVWIALKLDDRPLAEEALEKIFNYQPHANHLGPDPDLLPLLVKADFDAALINRYRLLLDSWPTA